VDQDLPLESSEDRERAFRCGPLGLVARREGPPAPARRPSETIPPRHLDEGVRHRPAIADDVDEARLRERGIDEAGPWPPRELVHEHRQRLRIRLALEEG